MVQWDGEDERLMDDGYQHVPKEYRGIVRAACELDEAWTKAKDSPDPLKAIAEAQEQLHKAVQQYGHPRGRR